MALAAMASSELSSAPKTDCAAVKARPPWITPLPTKPTRRRMPCGSDPFWSGSMIPCTSFHSAYPASPVARTMSSTPPRGWGPCSASPRPPRLSYREARGTPASPAPRSSRRPLPSPRSPHAPPRLSRGPRGGWRIRHAASSLLRANLRAPRLGPFSGVGSSGTNLHPRSRGRRLSSCDFLTVSPGLLAGLEPLLAASLRWLLGAHVSATIAVRQCAEGEPAAFCTLEA
jgi:hypothetical protein